MTDSDQEFRQHYNLTAHKYKKRGWKEETTINKEAKFKKLAINIMYENFPYQR